MAEPADKRAHPNGPTVALAANDPWNIVNYRAGLIRALQHAGHSVVVLAPPGAHGEAVRALGVDFQPVTMSPRGTSPLADLGTLAAFRRALRAIRPAAFLGFTAKPNIYGSIAARALGIPVINNISGLGSVFARESLLTRLLEQLYRFALRRSAVVFFQNRDDLQLFVSRRLVSSSQAALLPGSGVNLSHFAPRRPERGSGPMTFLLAGRLLWDKGVAEYVEAARRLRSGGVDARFQILGMADLGSAAGVPLGRLREWQAEGIIDYLGTADDVREALANADCVVLPSYYREGVPRILLEASAMGVPVITTDMPGCREAVEDSATGFLCQPRSVDSLCEVMTRMAQLPAAARSRMGSAARRKMEDEFREEVVHRAYIEALGKLGVPTS